jgi:hypothetical protein
MQLIRARVAGMSDLCGQLIGGILREYYQFSPGIAAHLDGDEVARTAVLKFVVRPLTAWFTLAVTLGLEHSNAKAVGTHVQAVVDACTADPGGFSAPAVLEAIRSGKPLPGDTPQAIQAFAEKAGEMARLPFARWAILEPLVRAWSLDPRHADVIGEVSEWLATAPLEALAPQSDPDARDGELRTLAGFFDFRPIGRRHMGTRLAAAWPQAVPVLQKYGFV